MSETTAIVKDIFNINTGSKCDLAGMPTSLSPSLVNATTEGVVRAPSEFSITFTHHQVEISMPIIMELSQLKQDTGTNNNFIYFLKSTIVMYNVVEANYVA
jgi:hypothetical protein